jgi:hypothetical protein
MFDRDADLQVGDFKLWIDEQQPEQSQADRETGRLEGSAQFATAGSAVFVEHIAVPLGEMEQFGLDCAEIARAQRGEARLSCIQPDLRVLIKARSRGHLDLVVQIASGAGIQPRLFKQKLRVTAIPDIVRACRVILEHHAQ